MKIFGCHFNFFLELFYFFGIAEYVKGKTTFENTMGRDIQMIDPIGANNFVTLATFNALVAQEAALTANFYQLQATVSSLVTSVKPKCPPTAPSGSLVAGLYCYSVYTTPDTFANAVANCNSNKGILAEPLYPNSAYFYNLMATTSTQAIGTIGSTGKIWIGLQQPSATPVTTPFAYLSNGLQVPAGSIAFGGTSPPLSTDPSAAVLVFPGTSNWLFADTATGAKYPYICQFSTVL